MTKYTFELSVKSASGNNDIYSYSLDLTFAQENNPEQVFTSEFQQEIRSEFQKKSACLINDYHLNLIIQSWLEDIQEGYRQTRLILDLPSIMQVNASHIQENGTSDLPELVAPTVSDVEPLIGALPPLTFK